MNEDYASSRLLGISQIKYELMTRRMEIISYLHALLKPCTKRVNRFVIFAQWRTGSNLLADLLNSHPEITCEGEIFLPFDSTIIRTVFFPHLYIKGILAKNKTQVYGFNLKMYRINFGLTEIQSNAKKFLISLYDNGWKIIYLKRLNLLRQAISHLAARARNKWVDHQNKPIIRSKVNVDYNSLIKQIRFHEKILAEEKEILEKLPHVTVIYEKDLLRSKDHQKTSDMICEYLGLSSSPVKTKLRRISTDNLHDYIENYEELIKFFSTTKYASSLNED